jgi:hypothetical protein
VDKDTNTSVNLDGSLGVLLVATSLILNYLTNTNMYNFETWEYFKKRMSLPLKTPIRVITYVGKISGLIQSLKTMEYNSWNCLDTAKAMHNPIIYSNLELNTDDKFLQWEKEHSLIN